MPNPFQLKSRPDPSSQASKGAVKSNWDILGKNSYSTLKGSKDDEGQLAALNDDLEQDENELEVVENQAQVKEPEEEKKERSNTLLNLCSVKASVGKRSSSTKDSAMTSITDILSQSVAPSGKRTNDQTVDKHAVQERVNVLTKKLKTDPKNTSGKEKLAVHFDNLPQDMFGLALYSSVTFLSLSKPSLKFNEKMMSYYHFNPENNNPVLSPYFQDTLLKQVDDDSVGLEWKKSFISLYQQWKVFECDWFYYFHADEFVCVFDRNEGGEANAVINKSTLALCKCLIDHGFMLENDVKAPFIIAKSKMFVDEDLYSRYIQDSDKLKGDKKWAKPLVFTEHSDIHLLYDFLLNTKVKSFTNKKMVKCNRYLISNVPFQYATMDTLKQSSLSTVTRMISAVNDNEGKPNNNNNNVPTKYWQVQINGPIAARVLYSLVTLHVTAIDTSIEVIPIPFIDGFVDPTKREEDVKLVQRIHKSESGYSVIFS